MDGPFGDREVLIVTDPQRDFCPGGRLAVPRGDEIVPVVNALARRFAHVILTQDWHPAGHASFAGAHPGHRPFETIEMPYGPQTLWPDHCVQGSAGAAFHPGLDIPQVGADHPQGLSRGDQFVLGVSRKRPKDADRARRLSARTRVRTGDIMRPGHRFLRVLFGDRRRRRRVCDRGRA